MDIIFQILFGICAGFLYVLGLLLGLNYKEISVYFNLYFQSLLPIAVGVYYIIRYILRKNINIFSLATLGLIASNVYLLLFIYKRYPYSKIDYSFNLCVEDLNHLAKQYNSTYINVNIHIFIIGFLINLILYKLLFYLSNKIYSKR